MMLSPHRVWIRNTTDSVVAFSMFSYHPHDAVICVSWSSDGGNVRAGCVLLGVPLFSAVTALVLTALMVLVPPLRA